MGSSPLARGLPCSVVTNDDRVGIIPARAGFTNELRRHHWGRWDHPRSRGVYRHAYHSLTRTTGSSPLARGLLKTGLKTIWDSGIIPARAGFTPKMPRTAWSRRDHPRSRGVYAAFDPKFSWALGSSPLARGLLLRIHARGHRPGIIPARAGFTHSRPAEQLDRVDHPRSRGVYIIGGPEGSLEGGSSPLARGLPPPCTASEGTRRIIPARAGFTSAPTGAVRSPWDHPRSRGVYSTAN